MTPEPDRPRITCFGGGTVDRIYRPLGPLSPGTSNPAIGRQGFGGVARNVAENLARLGVRTSLATLVGDDESGRSLMRDLRELGIDTAPVVVVSGHRTAEYCAILGPGGDLAMAVADMAVFDRLTAADLDRLAPHLDSSAWVFADANLPPGVIRALLARRATARFRLAVDAVSVPKARRLPADLRGIDLLLLNFDEARAWLEATGSRGGSAPVDLARALRAAGAADIVLTLGARGLLVATAAGAQELPSVPARPVDVTGAGDALIAGTLSRLLAGVPTVEAASAGSLLAALTTECDASVHPRLSEDFLRSQMPRLARPVAALFP